MKWWGPSHSFEQTETADELTFQTTVIHRKGEAALGVILAIAGCIGLLLQIWALGLTLAFIAALIFYRWNTDKVRMLVVSRNGLNGDPDSAKWSDVFELRFESGGEDTPSGLFARTSLMRSKCVLQDVSRAEAERVEQAIYSKWSDLQMAPRPEGIWSEIKKSLHGES